MRPGWEAQALIGDGLAFGDLLRRHRLAAGLSQEALAERANLSARGLSDLERGARRAPRRQTVLQLANALELGALERQALLAASRQRPPARPVPAKPTGGLPPLPLSSFVGRKAEVAELVRLVRARRLVTLTGTGGVGKTRLALQVAAEVRGDYPDGVWFIDLAPLADGELVARAVAAVLGIKEQPNRPMADTLAEACGARRQLWLLDNCEHLIEACAGLASRQLHRCPELRILATSREPLRVEGETAWPVPTLRLPQRLIGGQPLQDVEAVQLFVERAATAQPAFRLSERNAATVVDICRRLDGIPLAIELAAARVRLLSVEQLAERLDDRFRLLTGGSRDAHARQQTLRAAIQWSYDLLPQPERRLFDRLSVFAGRWSLEAAEAVCAGPDIAPGAVLDLVAQLVLKSLVHVDDEAGTTRFRQLETLREYGREHLQGLDAERTRDAHADFFLRLAEAAEPELWGPGPATGSARLEQQHDNLRAALTWCVARGDAQRGLRLAAALTAFWLARGHLSEGRAWLRRLLALPEEPGHALARATALTGAARLASYQGDDVAARELAEEAIARLRALRTAGRPLALALAILSYTLRRYAELEGARARAEEGIAVSRASLDRPLEALNLLHLGRALHAQGQRAAAGATYEAALWLARETDFARTRVRSLCNLGLLRHEQGDLDAARAYLQESLTLSQAMADKFEIAGARVALARLAADEGEAALARQHLAEGLTLGRELGNRDVLAACLAGLARVLVAEGQTQHALRLVAVAEAWYQGQPIPTPPDVQDDLSRTLAAAQATLSPALVEASVAIGRLSTMDQVIADLERSRPATTPVAVAQRSPTPDTGPQPSRPDRRARQRRRPASRCVDPAG